MPLGRSRRGEGPGLFDSAQAEVGEPAWRGYRTPITINESPRRSVRQGPPAHQASSAASSQIPSTSGGRPKGQPCLSRVRESRKLPHYQAISQIRLCPSLLRSAWFPFAAVPIRSAMPVRRKGVDARGTATAVRGHRRNRRFRLLQAEAIRNLSDRFRKVNCGGGPHDSTPHKASNQESGVALPA